MPRAVKAVESQVGPPTEVIQAPMAGANQMATISRIRGRIFLIISHIFFSSFLRAAKIALNNLLMKTFPLLQYHDDERRYCI